MVASVVHGGAFVAQIILGLGYTVRKCVALSPQVPYLTDKYILFTLEQQAFHRPFKRGH